MRERIARAAECVINEILASIWREIEYRFEACRATHGAHIKIC
jgi:hypothetical protein